MSVVIFGPPGSGKGTQGKLICDELNYNSIIAGDLLRDEIKKGTNLGKEISDIIDIGNMVPSEMISRIVGSKVSEIVYDFGGTKGYLFDGYPRNIKQGETLDELFTRYVIMEPVEYAIFLEVPEKVLIKRLLDRGQISGRADDQNEDIIKTRMDNYKKETAPLKKFYEEQGKLVKINGDRKIETIFKEVKKYITPPIYGKINKILK